METPNPQLSCKQDLHKEYNIILFGETGSGKSTLINYLTNYFHNGTLENLKIAIPTKHYEATEGLQHHDDNVQDSSNGQTRTCAVYNFRREGTIFNFIDTPGLSDSRGAAQDDFNIQQIMGAAEQSGVLTAIILVINGTQTRATVTLRNTLSLLRSSIPDVFQQNLVVVLTNCSAVTANFDLSHLEPWTIAEANVFHMNNCALSRPVSQWIHNERMKKNMEHEWQYSMETIEELNQLLTKLGGKATEAFKQMRINKNIIKSQLHGILLEVKKIQDLQNELDIMKTTQQNVTADIKQYSDYKRTKQVEYSELERGIFVRKFCIVCLTPCQDEPSSFSLPHTIPFYRDVTNLVEYIFKGKCRCGHTPFSHYDCKLQSVKKIRTVEEIVQDVKKIYDNSVSKNKAIESKIGSLDTDIAVLRYVFDIKEAEIRKCYHELKKLCSQFNFVHEVQGIMDDMERDARTLTSIAARTDAENRIRSITKLVDTLSKAEMSD
ncbi:uncharacterized protein LOC115256085 [Aedes albopictus]|uniref:AIG1-type G domain-containing protein n=1 Tax=Aedes albopictus TaxID=7160 RepID=A0ABM1Y4W8_AEDAL